MRASYQVLDLSTSPDLTVHLTEPHIIPQLEITRGAVSETLWNSSAGQPWNQSQQDEIRNEHTNKCLQNPHVSMYQCARC